MVQVEIDKSAGSKIKVACKECRRDTNHIILKSVEESGTEPMEPEGEFYWSTSYQIIQCQGCEIISFRSLSSNSEDIVQTGEEEFDYAKYENRFYPNGTEGRQVLKDSHLLPKNLGRIYRETVNALNGAQPVLAGIGIRAIIETVCKEKNATGSDLSDKIDNLVTLGVLTKDGAGILHQLRILGNKAAHEVQEHSAIELNLAMDVVEHILQAVYILPFHMKHTFE